MCKVKFLPLGIAAALAVAACGEADISAADETADGMAGAMAAAEQQAATEAPAVTIPAEFHGSWGFYGDCSSPLIINATEVGVGDDQPPLSKMEVLDDGVVEFDRVSNPQMPEADYRFGLSVAGPDMLVMSSPDASSMWMERCGAVPAQPATEVVQQGGGLPAAFHGEWDDTIEGGNEFPCEPGMGDISIITANTREFSYGITRFTNVRRIDANTYEMTGQHTRSNGEALPAVTTRYELSADGNFITERIEGYDPFYYERC
ncbi:hypothetical protein [Aurantiacibacter sediminis]|uniref:Lipoprotein n=1 Tax=Aurantiacibacter sediminis TaxID=2793064 RepID=A0ABS0N358_9SPHN|nr:hypothetical protein [Aurantiacibacter sediminis]MBH5321715.1 hypothetical protein [Aurantiacibacter sediminis]